MVHRAFKTLWRGIRRIPRYTYAAASNPSEPNQTDASQERRKYERMWRFTEYRDDHATAYAEKAMRLMGIGRGDSIIDYGSGAGYASLYFKVQGLRVLAIDIAANATAPAIAAEVPILVGNMWDIPVEISADWGFCCDVMEHIPTDRVGDVLEFIRRSTRSRTYFNISLRADRCGALINDTLHLTVRPIEWWIAELRRCWSDVRVVAEQPGEQAEFLVGGVDR